MFQVACLLCDEGNNWAHCCDNAAIENVRDAIEHEVDMLASHVYLCYIIKINITISVLTLYTRNFFNSGGESL